MHLTGLSSPTPGIPLASAPRPARPPADPERGPAAAGLREASFADLLTPDERAFFAQQESLGTLTYRPGGEPAPSAPAPLGQRIDVRV